MQPRGLDAETTDYALVRRKEKAYREKMEHDYNHRHRVTEGNYFSPGDRVWVPDLNTSGNVVRRHERPRSVVIETSRSVVRRNERMIRKSPETPETPDMCHSVPEHREYIAPPIRYIDQPEPEPPDNDTTPTRRSHRGSRQPRRLIEEC